MAVTPPWLKTKKGIKLKLHKEEEMILIYLYYHQQKIILPIV